MRGRPETVALGGLKHDLRDAIPVSAVS